MSAGWTAVIVVGAGTVALKAAGPVLVAGRSLPSRASAVLALLAPALLAALVVTEAFADGRQLVLDPRAAGLAVGALVVALRAPLLAVIVAAAVATALVRLVQ